VIQTQDVVDWLNGLDPTLKAIVGPYVPDMPDAITSVMLVDGPGLQLEGSTDAVAYQVRCRGNQRNPQDAESRAWRVDQLIIDADKPALIGGNKLVDLYRLGGNPAPVQNDLDGERINFTCTYVFEVGRS